MLAAAGLRCHCIGHYARVVAAAIIVHKTCKEYAAICNRRAICPLVWIARTLSTANAIAMNRENISSADLVANFIRLHNSVAA